MPTLSTTTCAERQGNTTRPLPPGEGRREAPGEGRAPAKNVHTTSEVSSARDAERVKTSEVRERRTAELNRYGIKVVRFNNDAYIWIVVERIQYAITLFVGARPSPGASLRSAPPSPGGSIRTNFRRS